MNSMLKIHNIPIIEKHVMFFNEVCETLVRKAFSSEPCRDHAGRSMLEYIYSLKDRQWQ